MRKSNYQIAKEYALKYVSPLNSFDILFKKKLIELEDRKYTLEEMNKAFRLGIATEAFGLSNKKYEEFIETLD